jgi:hypothetical protein
MARAAEVARAGDLANFHVKEASRVRYEQRKIRTTQPSETIICEALS